MTPNRACRVHVDRRLDVPLLHQTNTIAEMSGHRRGALPSRLPRTSPGTKADVAALPLITTSWRTSNTAGRGERVVAHAIDSGRVMAAGGHHAWIRHVGRWCRVDRRASQ